jgi:succinate dehydrogenase / fumarate reductase cytochrome b subunit
MTEASSTPRERPVSPHLVTGGLGSPLLWRWHITMWTSILHRATGVALYGGGLIVAAWAISLAEGPDVYATFKGLLGSIPGKVVMFGLTVSVFYHLASGVRHLVWDSGRGFEIKAADAASAVIFAFTVAATLVVWGLAAMTGAL